jgi:hypothetical protein
MKKVFSILALSFLFANCTEPEETYEPSTETIQSACPAPDTDCNGIPDHEETDPNLGG